MMFKNFFTFDFIDMILIALSLFGIYALIVVGISSMKQVEIKEAKRIFRQDFLGFFNHLQNFFATEFQLGQGDILDILSVIAKFSSIQMKNTKWVVDNFATPPYFRVEILDPDFLEHFYVIENTIRNIFGRIFAYNSMDGIVHVTYERTLKNDIYQVVVFWATTPRSKKALEKMRSNIMEYNRRMDMEKNAPFIDRELDKEMEDLEDGSKN